MPEIEVLTVEPVQTVVVKRRARLEDLADIFMPAFDRVWAFLRSAGVKTGHNVGVFARQGIDDFDLEIGVQVSGEVPPLPEGIELSATPSGRVVRLRHLGPYDQLPAVHGLIQDWADMSGRKLGGVSWELYGDWAEDPQQLQTDVYYLLDT